MVDYVTRYPKFVSLESTETETIAKALIDMYGRLGVPEEILSRLVSNFMEEVPRLFPIKRLITMPYHPI